VKGEPLTFLGDTVKTAAGIGGRKERLIAATSLYGSSYAWLSRTVLDGYVETRFPLVSPTSVLKRLELNAAARYDDYSDVGRTWNPKVGLAWWPLEELKLRATYATSFRPTTLDHLAQIPLYYTLNIADPTSKGKAIDTLIDQSQPGPGLNPEGARTITAGLDLQPSSQDGLGASVSWFRTVINDGVAAPLVGSPTSTTNLFAQPALSS
jgi:outer membrane receptor protein involved in Fe transport